MGRTPKPLSIAVHPLLWNTPEVEALVLQGHDVHEAPLLASTDLVLGPSCWRMSRELMKYLPLSLKAARQQRYGGADDDTGAGGDSGKRHPGKS